MEVFVKKLAVLAICGCVFSCFGMDIPKFGAEIKNPELRELIQAWEQSKSGNYELISDRGLELLGQFCDELKTEFASLFSKASDGFTYKDRPVEKIDLLIKSLCTVYGTLEEVKKTVSDNNEILDFVEDADPDFGVSPDFGGAVDDV
jgi:hypothetical protein